MSWRPSTGAVFPRPTPLGLGFLALASVSLLGGLHRAALAPMTVGTFLLLCWATTYLSLALVARAVQPVISWARAEADLIQVRVHPAVLGPLRWRYRYHWVFLPARRLRGSVPLQGGAVDFRPNGPRGLFLGPTGELVLEDPFGWFLYTYAIPGHVRLALLRPRPEAPPIPRAEPGVRGKIRGSPRVPDDPSETRPYLPGDDTRRLHWKLWAHTGQLMVRQAQADPPPHRRQVLLVDPWLPPGPTALGLTDLLAERLWGLCWEAIRSSQGLEVLGPGFRWTDGESLEELHAWFAGLHPALDGPLPPFEPMRGLLVWAHPASPRLAGKKSVLDACFSVWIPPEHWGDRGRIR